MEQRIRHVIEEYQHHHYFSGACLIRRGDQILFEGAAGSAHRGFAVANTVETMFDTASVTKTFTAAAVLLLVQEGKLALDQSIVELLALEHTAIPGDVTLFHLLTHTSGIVDDADEEAGESYAELFIDKPNYAIRQTADFIPQFAFKPPNFKAGEAVRYNNCGFVLLGLAIEQVSGQDYKRFVRERIFAPLGMARSGFYAMDEIGPGVAEGYYAVENENGKILGWKKNIYSYPPVGSPDGGAQSTVGDLDRFIRAIRAGRLLDEAMTGSITAPQIPFRHAVKQFNGAPAERINGFAFEFIVQGDKIRCMRKDGINEGVGAMMASYPELDATIIILANQTCNVWAMHRELEALLLSEEPIQRYNTGGSLA